MSALTTPVKPVQAFSTSDGLLFLREHEANTHQMRLDFDPWYGTHRMVCDDRWLDSDQVYEWLSLHRDYVGQLLDQIRKRNES